MAERRWEFLRQWAPELVLAVLAGLVFLGCLGSLELWGKREQRAVAESIDTVDNGHWLVAEIQGRPRLEKPPLPRWTTAALMLMTGRRDEWLMRLPAALSALGMVALVYALGCRLGGRGVGLASGLALSSMVFFIVEMRQAGNDGPLAFFVSLAIYAAWRRLHGGEGQGDERPGVVAGARRWSILFYAALGLGFLCKGPIALLVVALAIVPYLAVTRSLGRGALVLIDGWGIALFVALALSWPVLVLLNDPKALDVWMLEMGQKAGTAGITHHRSRGPLALEWPAMTAPWTVLVSIPLIFPLLRKISAIRPKIWLPWFWVVLNLAMFCFWSVAKPNYFLPCMPAVALLGGIAWRWMCDAASGAQAGRKFAGRVVVGHWVGLVILAVGTPVVVFLKWPGYIGWSCAGSLVLMAAVASSVAFWNQRQQTAALAVLVSALAVSMVVGYGAIGPRFNASNGHRALARQLESVLPADQRVVLFYRELDEGLWYYLRGRLLKPVPGSQPRYNKGFDLLEDFKAKRIIWDDAARLKADADQFANWVKTAHSESLFVLVRAEDFDRFAPALDGPVDVLLREPKLKRNELMLLKVEPSQTQSVATSSPARETDKAQRR